MWLLLTFFIFTCYSQCFVEKTNSISTTVYFNQTLDVYDDSCIINNDLFSIKNSTITCIVSNSFTSTNFNLDLSDFTGSYIEFNMDFNQSTPQDLQNIQIVPQIDYYSEISVNFYLKYINDYTNIYIGCFDNESTDCNSLSKSNITCFDKSFTVFCDSNQSDLIIQLLMKHDNSMNSNGYPYLFFESYSELKLNLIFEINVNSGNSNGTYYLFTGKNINENYLPTIAKSVCSRKGTNRYLLFDENINPYTNCSCRTKYNDKEMSNTTIFNYPDCNYNSSMFDLILPFSSSTIYSLSDDLLEWYSIIFTEPNQSIQIGNRKTLTIDELNINQNDILFNEEVYVKYLTISTTGALFETLNFDDIDTTTIGDNTIILYFDDSSNNFYSFSLLECDVRIDSNYYGSNTQKRNMALIKTKKRNCYCSNNNNGFMNDNYCNEMKLNENNPYTLILESTNYILNSDEYWYSILSYLQDQQHTTIINIYGNYIITAQNCNFKGVTVNIEGSMNCSSLSIGDSAKITVNGNLYCIEIELSSSSELIVKGTLEVGALVYQDYLSYNNGIDNLNENGIIQSYGNVIIHSLDLRLFSRDCFELISTTSSISIPENTYGGIIYASYSLLSQNHLLRICPYTSTFNYEVECTTVGNTFEYTSFNAIHCPCIDLNCIINVNTTQLDSRNIEFSGTFNILTDSVIIISNKTSSFKTYIDVQTVTSIFIGEDSTGFEKNSLKSSTSTIKTVNNGLCQVLIVEYNDASCLICNGSITEDGLCIAYTNLIDHCLITNDKVCEECYEGYESIGSYCYKCPSNCLRCYNGECINCDTNYYITGNGKCESINNPIISIENNKTMKCNDGYYSSGECIQCSDDNCITCNSSQCLTCNNSIVLSNGSCKSLLTNNGEEIISNYGVIDCNDGYYSNNSQCIDCSLTFDNCEICDINGCLSCLDSVYVLLNDNSCSLNTNCLNISDSICLNCDDKGSWFNGNECIKCGDTCKNCINGYCIECNDGYVLQSENNCIENEYPDNCITLSYYGTCQKCLDGYYLNNNLCFECLNECTTCHNSTYCFGCNDGYMLNDNNECVDMSELNANCKTAIPGSSGGCAICNVGYYRNQTTCSSCISNCTKCYNNESCLICKSNYFLLNDASECISYDDLTNCETLTQSGCTKCNSSYYLNNQYCTSCSDTTENCNTCNNNGECLTCQNNYILINYECINYQLIDNCKKSSNSKCTSCSFWHTLNSDQTGCDTQVVWWVVVLIILFILIILIGIGVLIWYLIKLFLDWRKQQKQRKETTIFDMSISNILFKSTNNKDVVINTDIILFNDESDEIGVNEETRDLICVGNTSKHTIKVQFSVKDGCDKYEIRTNPQLITIPKGKACEFEIFIKPLCTCKINDQIMLISVDLTKGKTITTPITINTITIMTSRLDYDELIEDVKLGEGSFGIVYKGTFRGNQVAIKKLKEAQDNPDSIEEFNKEVLMLDKFRNDYIVHFYGAVFIPTKICMVTEFAQYGSLQDLMNKTKDNQINNTMKMKILLDCSKGIQYLHSNGILHRDIKPDNFLILSLQNDVQVNAKLTDFGSSRNVNMMMTNMTFTSGIGTPVYMAPEILKQNKYKKSADIYSSAITIYETMIWDEIYPKSQFKFPWKIAEFVTNGERLPKPTTMNDLMYSLIDNCWKHDPKKRYTIEEIIKELEEMN